MEDAPEIAPVGIAGVVRGGVVTSVSNEFGGGRSECVATDKDDLGRAVVISWFVRGKGKLSVCVCSIELSHPWQ